MDAEGREQPTILITPLRYAIRVDGISIVWPVAYRAGKRGQRGTGSSGGSGVLSAGGQGWTGSNPSLLATNPFDSVPSTPKVKHPLPLTPDGDLEFLD